MGRIQGGMMQGGRGGKNTRNHNLRELVEFYGVLMLSEF